MDSSTVAGVSCVSVDLVSRLSPLLLGGEWWLGLRFALDTCKSGQGSGRNQWCLISPLCVAGCVWTSLTKEKRKGSCEPPMNTISKIFTKLWSVKSHLSDIFLLSRVERQGRSPDTAGSEGGQGRA